MDNQKSFEEAIAKSTVARITEPDGAVIDLTPTQVDQFGLAGTIPATGPTSIYKTNSGWSLDPADASTNITLDESTGNIQITAPKAVTDSDYFKQTFDEDTLKQYSQAYKLNPDYKLSVQETNESTGEMEEKEVSIPEYIERLNSSLSKYMEQLRNIHAYKKQLVSKYGNKANNLTDAQVVIAGQETDKALYLPDILFSVGSFGKKKNPFLGLADLRTEDGLVSVEDFAKAYTRDNIGRDEMAAILTMIDSTLRGSGWDTEDVYTDENGIEYKNSNSAIEAAKLLSFRNYLTSHSPESTAWQQAGDYIESLITNAAYQVTRTFANVANIGEMVLTVGQGEGMQNAIEDMDEAMDYFNENNALVWDAVANAQIWGTLGGIALGTKGVSKLMSLPAKGVSKLSNAITAKHIATLASEAKEIEAGAAIAFSSLTSAEKAVLGINMAISKISGFMNKNFFTEFFFDTIHDAIVYDSTGFRDMIKGIVEAAPGDNRAGAALNYWGSQFYDNARWWMPMGLAKTMVKTAGKTTLGQAANVILTKYINKVESALGTKFQGVQDNMAGGSVVRKLEERLRKAEDAGETSKANHLRRQITIENQNANLREARKALGDIKLEWDGLKLTEESATNWKNAMTRIKDLEKSVDSMARGVEAETRAMLDAIVDPSTKKPIFLYEELAGANIKASQWYYKLVDLNSKYKLSVAPKSLLNQDVTDYWMGSFKRKIYAAFAETGTENGAKAQAALSTIDNNLETLRSRLPEEIITYVDEGIEGKIYQEFYRRLNQYGVENRVLVKDIIDGYESNPIWAENGYMPIAHEYNANGHWVSDDDKIEAIIEQEMDKLKFGAKEGEHFVDPEMVRQVRIRHMAQAKINSEIWRSYSGWGSNATNIVIVSGEETELARKVGDGQKALQNEIYAQSKGAFTEKFTVEIVKTKRRKAVKNATIDAPTREAIVASMSPSDISWYLFQKGDLRSPTAKLTDGVTRSGYATWFDSQDKTVQKYLRQQYGITSGIGSYDDLQQLVKNAGSEFESGLQRAFLISNPAFAKSSFANEAARNLAAGKDAFYQGVLAAKMKGELRGILNMDVDKYVDDTLSAIREMVDDYVSSISSNKGVQEFAKTLSESTEGSESLVKFLALQELAKEENFSRAEAAIFDQIKELEGRKTLKAGDVDTLEKKTSQMLKDTIYSEKDAAQLAARSFNAELTDNRDLFDEVAEINKRIRGAEERVGTDYVMYLDDQGRKAYAQVDPAFASLFNYRYRMEKAEASVVAKTNALMSKMFRWGTTSVNLSSFGNQLFRDFGNAIFVGGAWQTIRANADNLVNVFGARIVEQIKQFQPEEMKRIEAVAERTGETLERVAVSRELVRGAANAPSSTERTLYKTFMRQAYGGDVNTTLAKAKTQLQQLVNKWNPEDLLNGKRENYLRNRVYASALNDAMTQGYSLEQSRIFADFSMNNATTNFTRQLYHMQAIADSTPYFRAAINGTKSFWRMWSLDPVGITGRIVGGLILPTMYLTGMSLVDEESRAIYMNIPEYQKQDSLVFVFNGQAVSIPIPQELGSVVAPFRQFVEYLNNSNKNDFWELMMNDVLGLSPVDMQGFSTIDMDKMISDPTIFDRLNRGFSRVFSQMAPIPVKSAYMLATGTDPYTGKSLSDKSYMTYNEETGEIEVMDYDQNAFAKWFATLFGDSVSPELAEKVISGIFGTTGSNLLGDITKLLQEGPEAALVGAGKNIVEQVTKPFDVNEYNLTDAIWKRAIRQLTTEKAAILNSKEMQTYNSKLSQTNDPEVRKKILAQRQTLVDNFQQKVGDTIKRLSTEYEGTFDRKKLAAVINLLNFNSDPGYQTGSQYSSNISSEQFWDGRDAAVHTLERMGVTGAGDTSIFGYLTVDTDGNPVVRYTSPIAIMDMASQWRNQDDINAANIKALLSQNDIYNAHKSVSDQIQAIYGSKSKLTNQDYANIEAIQINWNAQLAKTLAPYLSKMTPEAAINNTEVLNALYPYIEVPGSWETKNGKYISLGSRGNKKKAFYDSWVKTLFGVNDPYKGQY